MAAQFSFMNGPPAPRADIVNRARDQLLAGACFSLDKNGGIRGRDLLDLFEHRFQSRTLAYDLLESARIAVPVGGPESCDSCPRRTSLRTHTHVCYAGSAFQSRSNTFEQDFVVERFCQKLHRACPQRLHPHFFVAMGRDEDDRNPATFGVQLRLQFQTRHSRHADIRDQTGSLVLFARLQEFFRRRKASCRQANRFQQVLHCTAHRIIIIDNRDQLGLASE